MPKKTPNRSAAAKPATPPRAAARRTHAADPAADPIADYIGRAPAAQQPVLQRWRTMVEATLPHLRVVMSGFPVWVDGERWVVGMATRAKGPMLYVMQDGVLDRFEQRLGRLRSGISCVEFRPGGEFAEDELWGLAQQVLDDVARELAAER